jgi:cytochrome c-type biogenesis protein CcmH/NrfG
MSQLLLSIVLSCLVVTPLYAGSRADRLQQAKAATALVVAINDSTQSVSMGSGFFLSEDGLIVTNAHVVEGGSRLLVYVQDRLVATAPTVLVADGDADLAALRVPGVSPNILTLAQENALEGTEVVSIGYPRITDILQMGFTLHATVGSGMVSGLAQGRSRTSGRQAGFVQTTGVLNFGNSGGPLIDTETGTVLGMVVTTVPYLERAKDRHGNSIGSVSMKSGIGYSIPAPFIRQWLMSHHLDVGIQSADPATRRALSHGAEPEADRSFATGHLLHSIALVLHNDSDLLHLAISHYETAAKLKPDAPWIARNLGLAYAEDGQWSHALQAFMKGLEFAPHDAALLTDAGFAWERTGDQEHAVEAYRAALRADAEFGRAHNNLGQILWKTGKHDEAIIEFRAALDADPTLGSASYNLGLALESQGLHGEALVTWESFLQQTVSQPRPDEWTRKIREGLTRLKTAYRPSLPTVMTSTR